MFKKIIKYLIPLENKTAIFFVLTFAFWSFVFIAIWPQMLTIQENGLHAGWINIWGDWAVHIAYTSYLSVQNEFPPELPILSGYVLSYPFGMDLVSGVLIRLGLDLIPAMIMPSISFSLILAASLFAFYNLILNKPKAALIAVFLFLFNGGLGFLWFIDDFRALGWQVFEHFPREYTHLQKEANIEWINVITSEFIPQRGYLLGLPLALYVLSIFWKAYKDIKKVKPVNFLIAGVITGFMPIIHMHSLTMLSGFFLWNLALSIVRYKKKAFVWIWYAVPSILIASILINIFFSHVGGNFVKFYPGWLAGQAQDNPLFFWIKNAGIMLFLPFLGLYIAKRSLTIWLFPFFVIFILANLFLFQPFPWDNTKFFTYWWLGMSGLGALFLEKLFSKNIILKLLGLVIFVIAIASGSLDVLRLTQFDANRIRMLDNEAINVGNWTRYNTPKSSIFLTGNNHDHPVTMLSGRRVVEGFPGWLWTYGIDVGDRQSKVEEIYRGSMNAIPYLKELNVNYVVIGPAEKSIYLDLDESFFDNRFPVVFKTQQTKIYGVENI